MKTCFTCKESLEEVEFHKNQNSCKVCRSIYYKKYYAENKERLRASNKDYLERNKAKFNETSKAWSKRQRFENPEKYLWKAAKSRAKKYKLEFNIEVSDIIIPDKCPALDLTLKFSKGRQTDNTPSLDRIDSRKGYIKGNVMVISCRANRIKNNATIDELQRLASFYSNV